MKLRSLVLVVSLLSAAAVQAQPPAPTPEQQAARENAKKACSADVASLCSGKEGHEAMMCLRSNSDKVSQGCKDAMSKLHRPGGHDGPPPNQQ
jgi:hypothetical protein